MKNKKIAILIKSLLVMLFLLVTVLPAHAFLFDLFGNGEGHFERTGRTHFKYGWAPGYFSLVKLNDGRVLVFNGDEKEGEGLFKPVNSEIYNPKTRKFEIIGKPTVYRNFYASTILLRNGKILIIGSFWQQPSEEFRKLDFRVMTKIKDESVLNKKYTEYCKDFENSAYAELYDPATGKFEYTGKLNIRRSDLRATLLNDGKVFVIGGMMPRNPNVPRLVEDKDMKDIPKRAEIYDPATGKFTLAAKLEVPNDIFNLITLDDGRVFIHLGSQYSIYDPVENKYSPIKNLSVYRGACKIVKISDGRVLILGGEGGNGWEFMKEVEAYDPKTDSVSVIGKLNKQHGNNRDFEATLLKDGRVLVTGGMTRKKPEPFQPWIYVKSAEIFDPKTGLSKNIGNTKKQRILHQAILLDDGSVLTVGGEYSQRSSELFIPHKKD